MKRTTVVLPDEMASRLEHERRRAGVSAAAIIRRALEAYLPKERQPKTLRIIGLGRSEPDGGIADDTEAFLATTWTHDILLSSGLQEDAPSGAGAPGSAPDTDSVVSDENQPHAGGR